MHQRSRRRVMCFSCVALARHRRYRVQGTLQRLSRRIGSSRNARKRMFQNASASASVNMRTSIFLYPPFCEIGRTLPFLVCVEVCYLFYITWVGVVAYSPGGSSFPGLHDPTLVELSPAMG